jgi:uncharacterized protein YecE (DUF72 family)
VPVRIGTSGWHYKSWVGPFYPQGLPPGDMLSFYSREFETVEINNSFYRLPADETLHHWAGATPPDFVFAFKGSSYLTHRRKLIDSAEPLGRVVRAAAQLRPKLGPILFQLPPRWRVNLERLRSFLVLLPKDGRFAFEFRDRSWLTPAVYEALGERGAALCVYEFGEFRSALEVTADFVYIRLHGPAGPYSGRYDRQALAFWKERIEGWEAEGRDVYCYFDNDERGYAADNARELRQLLGR